MHGAECRLPVFSIKIGISRTEPSRLLLPSKKAPFFKAHLGHKDIQSTLRYAHLSPKVTEETGEAVVARIYGGMV